MGTYKKRVEYVEAEQWRPGVQIPGVQKTGQGIGVTNTPIGNVEVHEGDWVITEKDGVRLVLCPEEFAKGYESDGPAADSGVITVLVDQFQGIVELFKDGTLPEFKADYLNFNRKHGVPEVALAVDHKAEEFFDQVGALLREVKNRAEATALWDGAAAGHRGGPINAERGAPMDIHLPPPDLSAAEPEAAGPPATIAAPPPERSKPKPSK